MTQATLRQLGAATVLLGASMLSAAPQLVGVDQATSTLIRIDTITGAGAAIAPVADDGIAGLTYDSNHGLLYASSVFSDNLLRIDPATGATTVVGPMGVSLMESIEYDSVHNVLYGITAYAATYPVTLSLCTINPATGAAALVVPHGNGSLDGLAFDPVNGVMYACDRLDRKLYTIDLTTAALTLIGSFGAGSLPGVGAAFDPTLGLFISDNHGDSLVNDRLFNVDTATGGATLIGNIGYGNVISLAFVPESAIPEPGLGTPLALGLIAKRCRRRA